MLEKPGAKLTLLMIKQAKQLHYVIWTLVASMTDCDDLDLRHLRLLLTRQARIMDSEGGIALSAFGIRMTYVNVIQVSR